MSERIVLAYSGGLDTSVAIGWIAEETGREVVAVAVDVGQGGEDLEVIRKRALDCGAVEAALSTPAPEGNLGELLKDILPAIEQVDRKAPDALHAAVIADPSTLRDRTLLHADKARIDAVDVVVGGQTVKLRKTGGPAGDLTASTLPARRLLHWPQISASLKSGLRTSLTGR